MDLIRAILLLAEEQPPGEPLGDFRALHADPQLVTEHIWLAEQAGLVEASFAGNSPSHGAAMIFRLTSLGHDFLAQARQPALWENAKATITKAGVGLTVDVMKHVLTSLAAKALGLPP